MKHVGLFAGIGGIEMAAHWAGFETVALVEIDKYCQKVLAKNFPGVPIHDDITTFDGRRYRGIELVSGGFPCQPHSVAGKRLASRDERDLWGETVRVLGEAQPRWFLGENVPGLLSSESGRFFGRVVNDLAALGFRVGWCVYGASDVGACHRRRRVFIVAYSGCEGRREEPRSAHGYEAQDGSQYGNEPYGLEQDAPDSESLGRKTAKRESCGVQASIARPEGCSAFTPDSTSVRREQCPERECRGAQEEGRLLEPCADGFSSDSSICGLSGEPRGRAGSITENGYRELPPRDWRTWPVKPVVCRNDDELSRVMVRDRVNILKALGNAVVPNQVYPILKAIAEAA